MESKTFITSLVLVAVLIAAGCVGGEKTDDGGGYGASDSQDKQPANDVTKPITTVSVTPSSIVGQTVNCIASSFDRGGLAKIEVFVDGTSRQVCNFTGQTSGSCTYATSTLSAGAHTCHSTVAGKSGNLASSIVTNFVVRSGPYT